MSKISLTNLVNLQNETTAVNSINANNAVLTTALDNTLSRDGTSPNQMLSSLDMNNNRIINLPVAVSTTEPVTLTQMTAALAAAGNINTGLTGVPVSAAMQPVVNASTVSNAQTQLAITPISTAMTPVVEATTIAQAQSLLGISGTGGVTSLTFDTIALATAAHIPSNVNSILTLGYTAVGDQGGAFYLRVGSLAAGFLGFQSADGAWWQIKETTILFEMAGCVGDGVTDETTKMQLAINSVPAGGTLFISPRRHYTGGNVFDGGFAFSSTLTVSTAINIKGAGAFSNLKPLGTFSNTTNVHINTTNDFWRRGIVFENFAIGDNWLASHYTRQGGSGIFFDAGFGDMGKIIVSNVHVGESGNNYSIILNGVATQRAIIEKCTIHGGILFNAVADSCKIEDCDLEGQSTFGIVIDCPNAGGVRFTGNTVTTPGGVIFQSGLMHVINGNYFEEASGFPTNNASVFGRNAQLAIVGSSATISGCWITANIFNMSFAGANSNPIYLGPNSNMNTVAGNYFNNPNNGNIGSIQNGTTTLIGGANLYSQSVHVSGGSYFVNYGLN